MDIAVTLRVTHLEKPWLFPDAIHHSKSNDDIFGRSQNVVGMYWTPLVTDFISTQPCCRFHRTSLLRASSIRLRADRRMRNGAVHL